MLIKTAINRYFCLNQNKTNNFINFLLIKRNLCQIPSTETMDFGKEPNLKTNVYLSDSFTKTRHLLDVKQRSDGSAKWVTMYCCGPTVYDDCHLGHAFTYIRSDLIRRVLLKYHNINVIMAMNITDIDDKIIAKANQTNSDYKKVSNIYLNSFIEDMKSLNVLEANCYLRVTEHMKTIIDYINDILDKGFAYISSTGDINFDFEHFRQTFGISDNTGSDLWITEKSIGKKSPKDFTLWKSAKPGEPKWSLKTSDGTILMGRPGWHIECSALAHKVFGSEIDLHFGGSDLRFPHHHCESCCCHAFRQTDSKSVYSWAHIWLHSGHLNLKSEKMSKSLGNVIAIKDFLAEHSPNILRLFCLKLHYRSELQYEEHILQEMKNIDRKLNELNENLFLKICEMSAKDVSFGKLLDIDILIDKNTFAEAIDQTEKLIFEGIEDDFDLHKGLEAVLDLAKLFNTFNDYSLLDVIRAKLLLNKWFDGMGLKYNNTESDNQFQTIRENIVINSLIRFRSEIRDIVLKSMKAHKSQPKDKQLFEEIESNNKRLLSLCDNLRQDLDGFGIKLKDLPVSQQKV